ncbi:probable plastid-lipid-associated protein 13, chloroplastic [Humulus lupulus]|uniref:probable plastid-lipid-associated protein 13, chloroplastic n=1 Tax=Humulus lupulus TaxID=3486 RepID=UPI002B407893|nr:probable plastid-lipid-associated protein 13, chloroplastic [Humulus lupulus]
MVLAAVGLRHGSTRGSTTVLYQLFAVSTIHSCCSSSSSVSSTTTSLPMFPVTDRRSSCLERLNLTPRPTTLPFLEGRWSFKWVGSRSPGLFAAKFISERFPSNLANLSKMDMVIKDGYARVMANMRVLNSIETKFTLSTKLTVEGPLRMREEYTGGVFETPKVIEEMVPEQLKGALGQAANTIHQLPVPVRDAFTGGLRVPLMFGLIFLVLCPGNNCCTGQNPVLSAC